MDKEPSDLPTRAKPADDVKKGEGENSTAQSQPLTSTSQQVATPPASAEILEAIKISRAYNNYFNHSYPPEVDMLDSVVRMICERLGLPYEEVAAEMERQRSMPATTSAEKTNVTEEKGKLEEEKDEEKMPKDN